MGIKLIELSSSGILLYESKHFDGHVIEEHRHQIHQILYVIDGNGTLRLDGRQSELRSDQLVLVVPDSNHAIMAETKLTVLVLAFNAELLELHPEFFRQMYPASSIVNMNPFMATEIRQLLRKMIFEQDKKDPLEAWALKIYLNEILLLLSRSNQNTAIVDSNVMRAQRICKYIDHHYYESVTAAKISDKMGISARYVNNIFKDCYGITPTQYLTEVRISVAKRMLIETDKDIVTVCFEVGYENLPTFYRVFGNFVKSSPHKFRKQNQLDR